MSVKSEIHNDTLRLDEPVETLLRNKGRLLWSISPDASVYQAVELMSEKQVGALVVLTSGRLAGIISERDYARKVILKGRSSHETRVRDIMTAPVMYVTPTQPIDECMRLMTQRRVRHLPVLEGERVVGVVSIGDVVNWLIASQGETIKHLRNYIDGSYPA
jgi:signal-transduction protein with cAMP-binding, CBS, and nucleotidyltransferase domain